MAKSHGQQCWRGPETDRQSDPRGVGEAWGGSGRTVRI